MTTQTVELLRRHLRGRREVVVLRVGGEPAVQPTSVLAAGELHLVGAAALSGVADGLRRGGLLPILDLSGCPVRVGEAVDGPAFTTDAGLAELALGAGRRILVPTWMDDVAVLADVAIDRSALLVVPPRLLTAAPPATADAAALRAVGRRLHPRQLRVVAAGGQVGVAAAVARMLTGRGLDAGAAVCAEVPTGAAVLLRGGVAVALGEDGASDPSSWRPVAVAAGASARQAMAAVLDALPLDAVAGPGLGPRTT